MATTSKVLTRGLLNATSITPKYTTPSATTTVITNIVVVNNSAAAITVDIGIKTGGTGVARPLFYSSIPASSTVGFDLKQVMNATDEIWATASVEVGSYVHISGVEIN